MIFTPYPSEMDLPRTALLLTAIGMAFSLLAMLAARASARAAEKSAQTAYESLEFHREREAARVREEVISRLAAKISKRDTAPSGAWTDVYTEILDIPTPLRHEVGALLKSACNRSGYDFDGFRAKMGSRFLPSGTGPQRWSPEMKAYSIARHGGLEPAANVKWVDPLPEDEI